MQPCSEIDIMCPIEVTMKSQIKYLKYGKIVLICNFKYIYIFQVHCCFYYGESKSHVICLVVIAR